MERTTIGQQFIHYTLPEDDSQNKFGSKVLEFTNNQEEETWKL